MDESRVGSSLPAAFAHCLRDAGVGVPLGSILAFTEALGLVDVDADEQVYWAARSTLLTRQEDVDVFDAVFDSFFRGARPRVGVDELPAPTPIAVVDDDASPPGEGATEATEPQQVLRWSRLESLREKDFASCSPDELAETMRMIRRLGVAASTRPSRRMRPAGRRGRPDLRRTVRRALRTGGEPLVLHRRGPSERPRRLVLLVDVSGSMEPYSRALLRFAHAASAGRRRIEVFALGTRLTRLSRALDGHDADTALRRAATAMADYGGGTRLGETLRRFNDRWGVRGVARGAVVVVLSDGWDRGDPNELAAEMARLHRVAHRIVWVNPLKASAGYEPLARGMAAALPHVDEFVAGHSVDALETLADVIAA